MLPRKVTFSDLITYGNGTMTWCENQEKRKRSESPVEQDAKKQRGVCTCTYACRCSVNIQANRHYHKSMDDVIGWPFSAHEAGADYRK